MGTINNFNYLKSLTIYPCALPGPLVLLETAIQAGVPTLLELESWSCRDIIKLRAGISYRCGRTLKAVIKAAHGAEVIDKAHYLYSFTAPIERLNWYLFAAELATSFVAHWQSMILQAEGCIPTEDTSTADSSSPSYQTLTAGLPSIAYFSWSNKHDIHHLIDPFGFAVPANWYWQATFSAKCMPLFSGPSPTVEAWIEKYGRSGSFTYPATVKSGSPGEATTATTTMRGQVDARHEFSLFRFALKCDQLSGLVGGRAAVHISRTPILEAQTWGVGCFNRDWSTSTDLDPRHRKR